MKQQAYAWQEELAPDCSLRKLRAIGFAAQIALGQISSH